MLQVYSRWTSKTVPHDFVIFFICNIENLFIAVFLPRKVIIILRKINFKRLSTVIVYSPSNSLGIFRHKCFKSTCEQVKSSNRLYYAWTFLQEAFKVSWKIFIPIYRSLFVSLANIFCIRICICKKYSFALLLFLGWKAK